MLCSLVWFTLCTEHSVIREKEEPFPSVNTANLWTKLKCWVPVQYSSNYAKLPGHTPLSESKATPQPSSLEQASKHNGLSLLFCLTLGSFYCSYSKQGTYFHPHSLASKYIIWLHVHPVDYTQEVRCFPTDWNGGLHLFPLLLSQQVI